MESTGSLMNNPQVKKMFANLMLIQKLSKLLPEDESDLEKIAGNNSIQVTVKLTKGEVKKIMQLIMNDSTSAQTFVSALTSSVANPEKKDEVIEDTR